MTITLPLTNQKWPLLRILVRQSWGGALTSGAGWQALKMAGPGNRGPGFYVKSFSRRVLPLVGEAKFAVMYGDIDGRRLFADVGSTLRAAAGQTWDPTVDAVQIPDLQDYIVRIQIAEPPDDSSTDPDWSTAWLGYVFRQDDTGWGASNAPAGEVVYHCVDLLHRAGNWHARHWGFQTGGTGTTSDSSNDVRFPEGNAPSLIDCDPPPYNQGDGATSGKNRSASQYTTSDGISVYYHTWPNSYGAEPWTDQQVVEHVAAANRPAGEPLFSLSAYGDSRALLPFSSVTGAHAVEATDTALDVIVRLCDRRRGRGSVFLDWTVNGGEAEGSSVTVTLAVAPQFYDDVTSTWAATTIYGASTLNTSTDVDLVGDHRVVDGSFSIADRANARYERVVTEGEPIEVAITLSTRDGNPGSTEAAKRTQNGLSLERAWTNAEQAAWEALSPITKRGEEKWRHVYSHYRLPRGWTGVVGDGNGGSMTRADYRCGDDGAVIVPGLTTDSNGNVMVPLSRTDTPPMAVALLEDLPVFQGYDYTGSAPVTTSSGADASTGLERGQPHRHGVKVWIRKGSDLFTAPSDDQAYTGLNMYMSHQDGLRLESGGHESGTRLIGNTTLSTTPARIDVANMALSLGLRLPHRVRFATGPTDAKRVLYTQHPGHHLWLAHPRCIFDLNRASGSASAGFAPRRGPCNPSDGTPAVLRDDRDALAIMHALISAWYCTEEHRPASWALKACGFLPSFETQDATVPYPTIGQLCHRISANGQRTVVNCPITSVSYDNTSGTTTFEADWGELDYGSR